MRLQAVVSLRSPLPALPAPADECGWAAILASDGSWLNASVSLSADGAGVVLTATAPAGGLSPVASSYAYNAWPVASVFSAAGFPVLPWGNEPVSGASASSAGEGRRS